MSFPAYCIELCGRPKSKPTSRISVQWETWRHVPISNRKPYASSIRTRINANHLKIRMVYKGIYRMRTTKKVCNRLTTLSNNSLVTVRQAAYGWSWCNCFLRHFITVIAKRLIDLTEYSMNSIFFSYFQVTPWNQRCDIDRCNLIIKLDWCIDYIPKIWYAKKPRIIYINDIDSVITLRIEFNVACFKKKHWFSKCSGKSNINHFLLLCSSFLMISQLNSISY